MAARSPCPAASQSRGWRADYLIRYRYRSPDDHENGAVLRQLGRGGALGEIALLEDIPRTADVVALTDVRLYALEKEPFLTAVTGHAPTSRAAAALVSQRHQVAEQPAG